MTLFLFGCTVINGNKPCEVQKMNIKHTLETAMGPAADIRLNDINVNPDSIRAVLINEVVPENPDDDFYGKTGKLYLSTVIPLFQKAGLNVNGINDILNMGIYITNAVKTPKAEYAVKKSEMEKSLPWLQKELALFKNVKVIMLMGDVSKKMFNQITKKHLKKNAVPSGATYKIRQTPFYTAGIRVMPSYILTGGNILIEKSKCTMIAEDLKTMSEIIRTD